MKVLKFGGTSVGSADRIASVGRLITDTAVAGEKPVVVLSAMAGTTNTLVEINDYLRRHNPVAALDLINSLHGHYRRTSALLFTSVEYRMEADQTLDGFFSLLRSLAYGKNTAELTPQEEKRILAQGELMSTTLMFLHLRERGLNPVFLPALDFVRTDAAAEPDLGFIAEQLPRLLAEAPGDATLFVTQGYICRDAEGNVSNLSRGGSDLTASLVGAAIGADEIQIWTDIDGMHNNDPRYVPDTAPVAELHFDEAAELAYFGAKILHPSCILPARLANIPVRLLNTLQPSLPGTLIHNTDCAAAPSVKAIAAKDGITALRIRSSRLLPAAGFIHRVFEIFDKYRKPIDLIATSEVSVSLTVDNPLKLEHIVDELREISSVTVDPDMAIVAVVGSLDWHNPSFEAKALSALADTPVRMISYGGSGTNISFLVRQQDKVKALRELSKALF